MVDTQMDRIIDVRLMSSVKPMPGDLVLKTPRIGIKPEIAITGSFLPSAIASDITLRCTNFYTKEDLSQYKFIRITAGYKNGVTNTIEGKLIAPYLERPSPDSVIVFRVLGVAYADALLNAEINAEWEERTPLGTVLNKCVQDLREYQGVAVSVSLECTNAPIPQKLVTKDGDRIRDVIAELQTMFPRLIIIMSGSRLIAYDKDVGRRTVHVMKQLSMANKNGPAISITAPWDPTIVQGEIVRVSPTFFKQALGSSLLTFSGDNGVYDFVVNTVDFSFSTNKDNSMIINALAKGQVSATLGA